MELQYTGDMAAAKHEHVRIISMSIVLHELISEQYQHPFIPPFPLNFFGNPEEKNSSSQVTIRPNCFGWKPLAQPVVILYCLWCLSFA